MDHGIFMGIVQGMKSSVGSVMLLVLLGHSTLYHSFAVILPFLQEARSPQPNLSNSLRAFCLLPPPCLLYLSPPPPLPPPLPLPDPPLLPPPWCPFWLKPSDVYLDLTGSG